MNLQAGNSSACQTSRESADASIGFEGFEPLSANYVYCPNQFFDVCLKSNSRGMVRVVAYILRQTLGWLDKNGEPVNQTVEVSYSDLVTKAGISRGAIKKALNQAVALGFIECHQAGKANARNSSGQSSRYTLRWDVGETYQTSHTNFAGFYAGQGNRTPIPNSFFDIVVPNNSLAITKVVGAIIRNSIGYQNQFGHRRQSVALSYSALIKHTCLSDRSTLSSAIKESLKAGFISRVEDGVFDQDLRIQSPAVYGIRWLSQEQNCLSGSKTRPGEIVDPKGFKNQTRGGSKTRPDERFKNQTSIEKKENNTNKQQLVAAKDKEVHNKLVVAGFSSETATHLISDRGIEVVSRQLEWIDDRKPKNLLAMLRKAIEQDWEAPERIKAKEKRKDRHEKFARQVAQVEEVSREADRRKRLRNERRKRLLIEWDTLSLEERGEWISVAAKRQSAEMLRKIILRQNPISDNPSFHILDEIARNRGLPTVSQTDNSPQRKDQRPDHLLTR